MGLTSAEARQIDDQIEREMYPMVREFVFQNALLPLESFKEVATSRYVAYAADYTMKARERGGLDETDEAILKGWWRVVMKLYTDINQSGGSRFMH